MRATHPLVGTLAPEIPGSTVAGTLRKAEKLIRFPRSPGHMNISTERIPLRVVAERAQVSRMTVSLALRDDPCLPVTTRTRIQKIAARLGYRPDPDIGHLMDKIREKRRRRVDSAIAYLTAHANRAAWRREPSIVQCFKGAERRANQYGYHLEEFWLGEGGMTEKRLTEIILNRGIEGVLIAPLPGAEQLFQDFAWDQFCAVQIGYSLRQPALHRACTHQFQSMFLLAQKLYEAGYRRIGLALSQAHDERVNHHWSSAFLGSQRLWRKNEIVPPLVTIEWAKPIFDQWLAEWSPDAIITIGEEGRNWLNESGRRVPNDIGLANVDLEPYMIGVTGIHRNKALLGFTAVDLLVSLVRHNERGVPSVPRINMVEGSFVQGTTTRGIR